MLYSLSLEYKNFRAEIKSRNSLPNPEELRTKII